MAVQLKEMKDEYDTVMQEHGQMRQANYELKEQILVLERLCQTKENRILEFENELNQQVEQLRAEVDKRQRNYSAKIKKSKHQNQDLLKENAKLEAELFECRETISKYSKPPVRTRNSSISGQTKTSRTKTIQNSQSSANLSESSSL